MQTVLEKIEPGCEICMENCGGAHHWARQLQARGFRVKLIAPQFVKPYVKSNKNDANNAEAIYSGLRFRVGARKKVASYDQYAVIWKNRLFQQNRPITACRERLKTAKSSLWGAPRNAGATHNFHSILLTVFRRTDEIAP